MSCRSLNELLSTTTSQVNGPLPFYFLRDNPFSHPSHFPGLALPNTTPSIPVKKEEPSDYVITAKATDEDSDDDMPLAQRLNGRSIKRTGSVKSESDDDEIPLVRWIMVYLYSCIELALFYRQRSVKSSPSTSPRYERELIQSIFFLILMILCC